MGRQKSDVEGRLRLAETEITELANSVRQKDAELQVPTLESVGFTQSVLASNDVALYMCCRYLTYFLQCIVPTVSNILETRWHPVQRTPPLRHNEIVLLIHNKRRCLFTVNPRCYKVSSLPVDWKPCSILDCYVSLTD